MTEVYDFDRAQREAQNVDALGKKWVIHFNRQNGLCYARPEPDRSDAHIPDIMGGLWTKASLLEEKIKLHVRKSWDIAEQKRAELERKAQVAKEQEKLRAKEAEIAAKESAEAEVASATGTDDQAVEGKVEKKKEVTKKTK